MESDSHLPVHWFWQSKKEFFDELNSKLPEAITKSTNLYIRGKILAFLVGRARNRKDFKELVAFKDQGLLELRFTLSLGSSERLAGLILARRDNGPIFLLWHVKDPEQNLEEQRASQNLDCLEAIARLKGMNFDNPNFER